MRLIFNGLSIVTVLVIVAFWLYLLRTNKAGFHNFNIWLALTVVVALTPILTRAVIDFMNNGIVIIEHILGSGDLFIIAVAISSDGIGRLLPKLSDDKNGKKSLKMYGIISCILMIIFSSLLYSSSLNPENSAQKTERVFLVSSIFFLMTVILSGSCVVLSEVKTQ